MKKLFKGILISSALVSASIASANVSYKDNGGCPSPAEVKKSQEENTGKGQYVMKSTGTHNFGEWKVFNQEQKAEKLVSVSFVRTGSIAEIYCVYNNDIRLTATIKGN